MKSKRIIVLITVFLCCCIFALSACDAEMVNGSVKTLTKPHIAVYECTEARLGEQDLLKDHEFIRITLLDKEQLEVSFKPNDGEKKSFKGNYKLNTETRELTAEIGVLGYPFKETTKIENGKFVINKNFLSLPLIMVFEVM